MVVVLTFVTVVSFTQDGGDITEQKEPVFKMEEQKTNILQLKEAVSKLSKGMTEDEVVQKIGFPLLIITGDYRPRYTFSANLELTLRYDFDGKLSTASNNDGFNLLSTEYLTKVVDFSVLIDGDMVVNSNTVLIINKKTYISIKDMAEQLGIKVNWDAEMRNHEVATTNIAQIIEVACKLSKGMTMDEVVQQIGEPTHTTDPARKRYNAVWGEYLTLSFSDGKLSGVFDRTHNYDLLSGEYAIASVVDFPVFINDKELIISNPVVTINDKIYVPIEDLAEQLGIKVSFNEEKQQLEITTK